MDKNKRWARIIIAVFVFVVVLIIIHIKKTASATITKFPKIRSIDVLGQKFKSEDLRGKIIYVQFINPTRIDDIASLNAVYRECKHKDLALIAVTNEANKFLSRMARFTSYMTVLEDQNERIARSFRSAYSDGSYYLFDQKGLLVTNGKNDSGPETSIKNEIIWLLYNRKFVISDFVPIGKKIIDVEWLRDLDALRERDFEYCAIALLNSVCYSCQSRAILDYIDKIHPKLRELKKIQLLIILARDYLPSDIENFRALFKTDWPMVIASNSLNEKWSALKKEFNSVDLYTASQMIAHN